MTLAKTTQYTCFKVGVADLIVVNKTDLVDQSHLDHVLQMVSLILKLSSLGKLEFLTFAGW